MLNRDPFGSLVVQGWILDVERHGDRSAVLAFYNGRFSGAFVPQIARADVLAAFGVQGAPLLPGFALDMSLPCQDDASLVLLGVTADGRYGSIALPVQQTKCP